MRYKLTATLATAGIILAQLTTGGGYNLGTPQTSGTYIPENNPGTVIAAPRSAVPSSSSSSSMASPSGAPASGSYQGPAYSFGAAPPPITSPGK